MGRSSRNYLIVLVTTLFIVACGKDTLEQPADADVIVVGAGIAGLSAALEASAAGARVLVIEASSVAGGHAVKAGGFAMVGTPLQENRGHEDTPDVAFEDLMAWGEDADPEWVRFFVDNSRTEVFDWLTGLGANFSILLDTPEDTVPRFHFAGGTAVKVIVPMLREAAARGNIRFMLNTAAAELTDAEGPLKSVVVHDTRTGAQIILRASAIILSTGGFQSNLDMVRANWRKDSANAIAEPERLLIGAGQFATGGGIDLGRDLGAALYRMDHQVTFINGLPDPRDPSRGLKTENPLAIWVDSAGRRFVNEAADSKHTEAAGLALSPQTFWMIFDSAGLKQLRVRGAAWLTPGNTAEEILDNPRVGHKSASVEELAVATGLPADNLAETINRYNNAVTTGEDTDFRRFVAGARKGKTVSDAPFYALQLFPMTRKSMGGLAIDMLAQVADEDGEPIAGLYAAGELTGVGGINGSHGGSGTFLAPSVLIGRVAGRNAAAAALSHGDSIDVDWPAAAEPEVPETVDSTAIDSIPLEPLLAAQRTGYWHFEQSHGLIASRESTCDECHSPAWPPGPALTKNQRLLQLDSCDGCH